MWEIRKYHDNVQVNVAYRDINDLKVIENFDGWSSDIDELNVTNFYDVCN